MSARITRDLYHGRFFRYMHAADMVQSSGSRVTPVYICLLAWWQPDERPWKLDGWNRSCCALLAPLSQTSIRQLNPHLFRMLWRVSLLLYGCSGCKAEVPQSLSLSVTGTSGVQLASGLGL